MKAKTANSFFMVFFAVLLPAGFSADFAQAGIRRIWAVDDGEKIKQEDIANPLATNPDNAVWNGTAVSLFGCRNEVVAFQLILEGDAAGQAGVDMRITDLGNGSDTIPGSRAGSSDPFDYAGKSIELFTEHYLQITRRSATGYHYQSPPPEYYCSGRLPDALIPFAAPAGLGGAPFAVPADQNQGVWVDVYIPRNVSAGVYTGFIEVTANAAVVQTIPIALQVYDFGLPDETHLQNMFYYNSWGDLCLYAHGHNDDYSDWYYQNLDIKYRQMAHRHRMTLTREVLNLDRLNRYESKYLDGSAFSAAEKYAGPGENTGDSSFCIGIYGTRPQEWGGSGGTRAQYWAGTDAWEQWFRDHAPQVYRFHQVAPDEPYTPEQKMQARTECEWMRGNPGVGKNIPTFTTSQVIPELTGYIDFWGIWAYWLHPEWVNLEGIRDEQAAGRRIGVYNGGRPAFGANTLDVDATDFRVNAWILKKYGMDFYYYWATTYWTEVNCFTNPLTFGNSSNGAGTFFYPGQCVAYPAEDRGLPGPLASIRMKNWRRGQQDYEYMWLAEQYGLQSAVNQIINNCVPRAAWEAVPAQNIAWSARGYSFDVYRRQLAEIIMNAQGRFSVSGSVICNGSGLADVILSGLPGNPVTDASGAYTARVREGWSGTVTPVGSGYTFNPANRAYNNVTADQTSQNYTAAALPTYTIAGAVMFNGNGLAGVTLGGLPGNPVTNGSGQYTATVNQGWSGTVTPSLAGYAFNPTNRTYNNVTANQSGQNYTATLNTYTISGTITYDGNGLAGVTLGGLPGNPVTNGSGQYTVEVPAGFSGTATPSLAGYTFSPANRTHNNVTVNQTGRDYEASASSSGSNSAGEAGGGGGGGCFIHSAAKISSGGCGQACFSSNAPFAGCLWFIAAAGCFYGKKGTFKSTTLEKPGYKAL